MLPFLELVLLIKTSHAIGFWATLLLMIGAAIVGGMVLAQQSASAFRKALEAASRGQTPHGPVLDGLFLMIAGILLVIPGFITDVVGLLLLIPPLRHWVARRTFAGIIWGAGPLDEQPVNQPRDQRTDHGSPGEGSRGNGPIIEGEFERLDERTPGTRRPGDNRPR